MTVPSPLIASLHVALGVRDDPFARDELCGRLPLVGDANAIGKEPSPIRRIALLFEVDALDLDANSSRDRLTHARRNSPLTRFMPESFSPARGATRRAEEVFKWLKGMNFFDLESFEKNRGNIHM